MYGNVSSLSPCPYAVKSARMHFARPCHPTTYVPARLPPSPHLHDDDDDGADGGDTVHSDAQYHRHPSPTPSLKNLHPMTHRTALVYGRYNKLGTDAIKHLAFCFEHMHNVLFDFFLPSPSLSTTASSHATRGPSRGPPRRRRVPAGGASAPSRLVSADASRCSAAFWTTSAVREPSRDIELDGPLCARAMEKVGGGGGSGGKVAAHVEVAVGERFAVAPL